MGSSPRVRGKLCLGYLQFRGRRLIPACAGKTRRRCARARARWAHPRVCGENELMNFTAATLSGSSPRVRGKLVEGRSERGFPRLIPACAGKTLAAVGVRAIHRAHPRVCGENPTFTGEIVHLPGSSPRVRGKQARLARLRLLRRLIPACAGKTCRPSVAIRRRSAHPRVCGENVVGEFEEVSGAGSSPRVRGKHPEYQPQGNFRRLIPACAGKTPPAGSANKYSPAHPRVCGENPCHEATTAAHAGSSPRVRGKRRGIGTQQCLHGLIPACAGKTSASREEFPYPWAHPRVCGENSAARPAASNLVGSSPRVRGKPVETISEVFHTGLIPACAGKTSQRV